MSEIKFETLVELSPKRSERDKRHLDAVLGEYEIRYLVSRETDTTEAARVPARIYPFLECLKITYAICKNN
jgi:hypothetical protein